MRPETGKTEATASEVAGVLEAEAEAEVMMTVGTVERTSENVTDEALTMILGVGVVVAVVVVAEATVLIEADMVGTVLTRVRLIPLAAAITKRQTRQLLITNLLPDLVVRRYVSVILACVRQTLIRRSQLMIAWNKLDGYSSCWLP